MFPPTLLPKWLIKIFQFRLNGKQMIKKAKRYKVEVTKENNI